MKQKIIIVSVLLFLLPLITSAHQPQIVKSETIYIEGDPEISKAYYGQLLGKPHIYEIESDKSFNLFTQVTVPVIDNATTDYDITIIHKTHAREKSGQSWTLETITKIPAKDGTWDEWYEPFAGDHYYRGKEFEKLVLPGTYNIVVSSPDNEGKYVLAVGKIEKFSLKDIADTIVTLPTLKRDFFNKSPFTAFFNLTGLFLLIILLLVAGLNIIVIKIYRKFKKSKNA